MYNNWSNAICIPEGVEVLEGGTMGIDLLPELGGRLLVVDTRETGEPPGALQRLDGNDITLDCR